MSTPAQVRAIQSMRRRAGLDDEASYRGFLQHHGGASSSRTLTTAGAGRVIEALKMMSGVDARPAGGRRASETASGRFAPVLRALWISAHNLGLARSGDDKAMMAFVERQTGLHHARFLVDPADARSAIEGLKAWIAREGGVAWPADGDPVARKWAVAQAIAVRLQEAGGFEPFVKGTSAWPDDVAAYGRARGLPSGFTDYSGEDFDELANMLGRRLRATLADKARKGRVA